MTRKYKLYMPINNLHIPHFQPPHFILFFYEELKNYFNHA